MQEVRNWVEILLKDTEVIIIINGSGPVLFTDIIASISCSRPQEFFKKGALQHRAAGGQ
jgi:hypothetical protein